MPRSSFFELLDEANIRDEFHRAVLEQAYERVRMDYRHDFRRREDAYFVRAEAKPDQAMVIRAQAKLLRRLGISEGYVR